MEPRLKVFTSDHTTRLQKKEKLAASVEELQRGNIQPVIDWYVFGEGARRIRWTEKGDHSRCVALAARFMTTEEAHGFCNLRSFEATGHYSGECGVPGNPPCKE